MKISVRPGLKLALALLFVLAVYFRAIGNPFSCFDDPFIVQFYGINSTVTWLDVLKPGSGFYYRPLVNLSFWLDYQLWGMDPSFMHLENIVAHLANVFLVFLIASRLPVSSEIKNLPFLSALLFGIHPINSESVNWIAARTDVYAGVFVLFAVYCLIRAVQEESKWIAILAFGIAFVGMLTKETGIMFIPAAFLISTSWPVTPQDPSRYRVWRKHFLFFPIFASTCLVSLLLLLVFVKGHGNNAVSFIFDRETSSFIRYLEAFGFYVKKLFLPLPLNVAIVEVDSLYLIAGVCAICICVATFMRAGISGILLTLAALFILPALIVATTTMAWTPFGERYLYIPSAFAVIALLELTHRSLVRWRVKGMYLPIVGFIIVSAAIVTAYRGNLWRNNLALVEDTVAKSPNFGVARNEYGVLLKQAGRFDEAKEQFIIATQKKNKDNVARIIHLNLVGMMIQGKKPAEARKILLLEMGNKANGDVELLKLVNVFDEYLLGNAATFDAKKAIVADILETNESLYLKTRDPHHLYRSGQFALFIGDKQKAAEYFKKTWENANPKAYYREPARILAEKLGAK
jgi:tetratricopeptide (TPR) repeat protein